MRIIRSLRHLSATALAVALLAIGAVGTGAQDSTPAPRGVAYPVSIHEGTCEDPVAQPIGPTIDTEVAGYAAADRLIGTAVQPPVLIAQAEVEATLDELTETPHVVAVHASPEEYGEIVACGEISGYLEDGKIVFALQAMEGSEVSGIAILDDAPNVLDEALEALDHEELLDDGELLLTVYIVPGEAEYAGG
ncbi:MAG: hypothetical protein M3173_08420 [Chloroflexota bacterium]|nr:hypothetical protein [Chloroflexota bacterium]